MKKLFTILAVAAAVVACQKNETIALDNGEAISFGNAFVENSVRAEVAADPSLNATTFTSFKVWGTVGGVPIYANNTVTGKVVLTDGEPNIWSCAEVKQYWIKDAQYKFSALANAGTVTLGDDKLPAKTTFDATAANVDLLYAEPVSRVGVASGNAPVAFTFNHLLSKVKFTVNNGSTTATGYSFKVHSIVVNGSKTGTITLADKTWSEKSAAADYTVADIAIAEGDAKEECASELLLIPGNFNISFKVDIICKGTTIATHNSAVSTQTLVGGHAYNFTIGVAVGEEITFTVEEAPEWTNSTPYPTPLQ